MTKNRVLLYALGALAATCVSGCSGSVEKPPKPDGFKELTFDSSDHRKVYADFYPANDPNSEKVILMFHQAGSNCGEYENVESTAAALGYNCIAVDLESGGEDWGRDNRTASKSGSGDYMAAYHDMEGAVEYANSKNYTTIVLWGSSYSASLAMKLAPEATGVKGLIVFSPGEYFDDKGQVEKWAANVSCPVLFACTPEELSEGRQKLFDAMPSDQKTLAQFGGGVHGTATTFPNKSPASDKYIKAAKDFLAGLK